MWEFIMAELKRGKWRVAFLAVLLWPVRWMQRRAEAESEKWAADPKRMHEDEEMRRRAKWDRDE